METYQQIKARHQADVNAFPMGCAFGNKQVAEMMEKFGLPNDKSGYAQIIGLGAGCYIKRTDIPAWKELCKRHDQELAEFRKDHKALENALRYEFQNHESQFCLNEETICRCVGLRWSDVENDEEMLNLFWGAWKKFMKDCQENGWF